MLNASNAIEFIYNKYPAQGEYSIKEIYYASHLSLVEFHYADNRPDKATYYSEGSASSLNKRLSGIDVKQQGKLFRSLNLKYQENSVSHQSQLTAVQECSASHCFPKTEFKWSKSELGFDSAKTVQLEKNFKYGKVADINGNGREDYIAYTDSGHIVSYISDGKKLVQKGRKTLLKKGLKSQDWYVFDYTGNGKSDILYRDGTWKIRLSNGTDYADRVVDTKLPAKNVTLADVDGDGLPDLLYYSDREAGKGAQKDPDGIVSYGVLHKKTLAVRYLRPNPKKDSSFPYLFAAPKPLPYTFDLYADGHFVRFHTHFAQDISGDGRVDYVIANQADNSGSSRKYYWNVYTRKGNDDNYTPVHPMLHDALNLPQDSVPLLFVDINGDGLPDWLRENKYYLNTGNGFDKGHDLGFNVFRDSDIAKSLQFIDYNGNGKKDMFYVKGGKTWVKTWNGNGFDKPVETSAKYRGRDNIQFLDLNGDGRKSYVYFEKNGKTHIQSPKDAGSARNVIVSIVNGLKNETKITYKPLTDSSVYTKGTGGAFKKWGKGSPVFDLMAPSYVVSKVESSAPAAGSTPGKVNNNAMSSVSYQYADARVQGGGRGMLGFGKLTTIDNQTGVKTTTTYRQDFPFIGAPLETEVKTASGLLISSSTNTWEKKAIGGAWQTWISESSEWSADPYAKANSTNLSQNQVYRNPLEKAWKKLGKALEDFFRIVPAPATIKAVRTKNKYDNYGNPTEISITTTGGGATQTKVTTNQYTNDTNKWHLGRLTKATVKTTENGKKTTRTSSFTYDAKTGMLKTETVEPGTANELTTTYTHDAWGNTIKSRITGKGITPRENRTEFSSSGLYADRSINTLNQTTSSVVNRDAFGRPLKVLDINSLATTFTYDGMGRQISQRHISGSGQNSKLMFCSSASVACPAPGALVAESQPLGGAKSWVVQDKLGREIRKIAEGFDGKLIYVDTEYDNLSRPIRVSEPYYRGSRIYWNETRYDTLGRPVKVTQAGGNSESYTYAGSYYTEIKNGKGQIRKEFRNGLGQLVKVEDHLKNTVTYDYDTQGNLTRTVQYAADTKKSATTDITYDVLGRKIAMNDPDKGRWSYKYDALGQLIEQTDAKGQKQLLTYDLLGRMLTRIDKRADGSVEGSAKWVYDTKKKGLLSLTSDSKTGFGRVFSYDNYARLSGVGTTFDKDTYYQKTSYDKYGRVSQQQDAAGTNSGIRYEYNARGYLYSVRDLSNSKEWYRVDRMDARGNATVQAVGGLKQTRNFAPRTGFLEEINTGTTGVTIQNLTYEWDLVGNLTRRVDNSTAKPLTETFKYDHLNRLTQSAVAGRADNYRYDGLGNITFKTGVGNYTYGENGAGLHAVTRTSDHNVH